MIRERQQEKAFEQNLTQEATGNTKPRPAERRRYERFSLFDYIFSCFKKDFLHLLGLGKDIAKGIKDLSAGGVKINSSEALPPGTKVYFQLHLPRFSDGFNVSGEVRWVKEIKGEGEAKEYLLGIQFTDIGEQDVKKIEAMRKWFTSPHAKLRRPHP
jgi:c-di-GMP-binding flagellar brake protein YcgR